MASNFDPSPIAGFRSFEQPMPRHGDTHTHVIPHSHAGVEAQTRESLEALFAESDRTVEELAHKNRVITRAGGMAVADTVSLRPPVARLEAIDRTL